MRYLRLFAFGVASISCSLTAMAATLSSEKGALMVNSGDGYKAISTSTEVQPGAQIMVAADGTAIIRYSKNCSVRIGSGRVWTVAARTPCSQTANLIDLTKASFVGANSPPPPPLPGGLLAVGLGVAGAVGLGIYVATKDDDKPASP